MDISPIPAEVDSKARQYHALKDTLAKAVLAAKEAQVPLHTMKEELIGIVKKFGSAHADKSKILYGITHEMMVTFGQSVSLDAAAVERFRVALADGGQARLCAKIFEKTIRYSLMPDSGKIVKGFRLSKPMLALYSQCEVINPRSPILQVRTLKGEKS